MATLEFPSSIITLDQNISTCLAAAGSMQRTRGMGRGQQREPSSDVTHQDTQVTPPRGGRQNSKLKVLVRSHAMREETSPPREPTPTPCINLISSPSISPDHSMSPIFNNSSPTPQNNPCSILSPGRSPIGGSTHSSRCSPTTIALGSPTSPNYQTTPILGSPNHTSSPVQEDIVVRVSEPTIVSVNSNDMSTVRTQDALNSAITRKLNGNAQQQLQQHNLDLNVGDVFSKSKCDDNNKTVIKCAVTKISTSDMIDKETNSNSSPTQTSFNQKNCVNSKQMTDTQRNVDNNTRTRNEQSHYICDCFNQNCTKCSKNNEQTLNNNNNSNNINNNNVVVNNSATPSSHGSHNTLTVSRASVKHKLRHQSSSQGSFEGSSSTSPCLSRDSSTEQYTDTTGIDLTQFILETLNKNAKDRVMMLKIEQELVSLAKDKVKTHFKFPPMSSYQRMLVHRCAAYFGMDHNIEISGKCVIVNKTKNTRIPDMRFKDHIREDLLFPEEPRRSILKRDSNSFEDCNYKSPDRQFDNRRSKSFEEREEEYEKVRRRIFKDGTMQECSSQEDFNWAEIPWPESECSKIRLLPPEPQNTKQNRLLKVQSVDGKSETLRPCVAKSYSFGGYGGAVSVLTRGDSVTSTHSAGPRLLTKQDSSTSTISWRLSPSSSGYKSQSQRSDSVTPSPTATPHQLSDASEETVEQAQQTDKELESTDIECTTPTCDVNQIVWAVTDMQSVPKGSVLINPQSGQPFTNQDGSIYHFDPSNPPPGFQTHAKPPPSPPKAAPPQKSPIKERSQSPKKQKSKATASPLKNKSCLINSSTSPSLPTTPPVQSSQPTHNTSYTTNVPPPPMDHTGQMPPIQPYSMYANSYVPPNVQGSDGSMPVYQPPLGMVYSPYTIPPPYENRPEGPVQELPGYFVNMAITEPPCVSQPVGYQTPSGTYWGQQPVTYYQPPATHPQQQQQQQQVQPQQHQQRYSVQIPVQSQTQGTTYVSTSYQHPTNYVPNPAPVPQNADLVPVYTNPPMQMMYPSQQPNPTNPVYIQNSSPVVYTHNPLYPHGYPTAYPPNSATPNSTPNYGPNTTPNQCYNQSNPGFTNMATGYDSRAHQQQHRNTPKSSNKCTTQKIHGQSFAQAQNSNPSTGGSNSPANTVITGYFPSTNPTLNYRQCTPPDTPPNQNMGYGYPPNYVPHSVIFRPLGGVRASPPMNIRSSRSPTPGPEYPPVGSVDRNQRYAMGPTVYHGMPCIVPGDMRLVASRAPPPMYRQPYRQINTSQSVSDNSFAGRSHKVRKPRTKVPALPPSGRQSNQSVQAHTQQRF